MIDLLLHRDRSRRLDQQLRDEQEACDHATISIEQTKVRCEAVMREAEVCSHAGVTKLLL